MYIRKKKGVYKDKIYINYQLVESVRTPNGPRQKVICSLGNLKLEFSKWGWSSPATG